METNPKHPQCKLCSQNAGAELDLSERAMAEKYDVHRRSVSRHRAHLLDNGTTRSESTSSVDAFLVNHGVPTEKVTKRQFSGKDEQGNWHKAIWDAQSAKEAVAEITTEDIEEAISSFKYEPLPTSELSDQTFVLSVSDLQIGKVQDGMGTEELINRVLTSFHKAKNAVAVAKPKEILFLDLGDILEGFDNVPSQRSTNDLTITQQVRVARRLLVEGIKLLAPYTAKFTYGAVPSNHCQVRIGKHLASTVDDDWGLEISYQIEDLLAENPYLEHVSVVRPAANREAFVHETSGTKIAAVHGHQAKSPEKIGDWWKGQSHGRRDGLETADFLMAGHYHSTNIYQSGGRWVMVTPTSDNGSDWFSQITGESSQTGMLSYFVKDGQWSNLKIL